MTQAVKCGILTSANKSNNTTKHNMNVTLQIPLSEYGKIATLAAAANMPLDKYLAENTAKYAACEKAALSEKAANKQD